MRHEYGRHVYNLHLLQLLLSCPQLLQPRDTGNRRVVRLSGWMASSHLARWHILTNPRGGRRSIQVSIVNQ